MNMKDFSLSVQFEKHLTNLVNIVKCRVCSNILLTPVQSSCNHVACAKCFSSCQNCPECGKSVDHKGLRPNEPISQRAAAVLRTIKAYETVSGRKVQLTITEIVDPEISDLEDSEDWFFKKDKKFSKKYEKRNKDSLGDNLLSVSQNDTPLIFPGENIDSTQETSEIDKNPNAIDKVQEWLSISQINVGATASKGPVKHIYSNRMVEDFFQKKLSNVYKAKGSNKENDNEGIQTRNSLRLSNKSPSKTKTVSSPAKSNNTISPKKNYTNIKRKSQNSPSTKKSSPAKSNKSAEDSLVSNSKSVKNSPTPKHLRSRSSKLLKNENTAPVKSPVKANNSRGKKSLSKSPQAIKGTPNAFTPTKLDSDASNNISFKADDSELEQIFTKVLRKKKSDDSIQAECGSKQDESTSINKDSKNPWKNVKKMKRVLNRPIRPLLKKLNISVAERSIPIADNNLTDSKLETVVIEDSTSLNKVDICATPDAVRDCCGISIASSSNFNFGSHQSSKKIDKDYLACQAAIIASKQQVCQSVDKSMTESLLAEPVLTHFSPVRNVGKQNKKVEGETVVANILKDFEIEHAEDNESDNSLYAEISMVDSSAKKNTDDSDINHSKQIHNLFDSVNMEPLQMPNSSNTISQKYTYSPYNQRKPSTTVPFVYKGTLDGRNAIINDRKTPFYHKSKSVSKDWYQLTQDGFNIQLQSNNTVTSIFIRNQQLANISQTSTSGDSVKIVQTRDAQTSPIPFSLLDDNAENHEEIPMTGNIFQTNKRSTLVTYRMHPNLQRFTNCITPFDNITKLNQQVFSTKETLNSKDFSINHTPHRSRPMEATSPGIGDLNKASNTEIFSPPLIVSEPIPDPILDPSKKRKFPVSFGSAVYQAKKPKTLKNNEPSSEDVNVVFISTQDSVDNNRDVVEKINLHEEDCNLDSMFDPTNFIPSQRKTTEDVTDLRILSMDVEPENGHDIVTKMSTNKESQEFTLNTLVCNDKNIEKLMKGNKTPIACDVNQPVCNADDSKIKDSENMFTTMFEKNTVSFSQESQFSKSNAQIVSSLNLPQSIQQLRREDSKLMNHSPQAERTVELSPHEELLLTPSMKVGESIQDIKQSQDLCTPIVAENDSDSSMFEDTPQKPRRFTTIKKSTNESFLRASDAAKPSPLLRIIENMNDQNMCQDKESQVNVKKSDTPMSISKFSDAVKVCSTPVVCARRSLSYKENLSTISEDEEVAGCSKDYLSKQSASHTATCMEKELLEKAFESSFDKSSWANSTIIGGNRNIPKSQSANLKNRQTLDQNRKASSNQPIKSICAGCSCLNKAQVAKVKTVVANLGWKFTSEYTDELTHLVVHVDENNRSQRSFKYVQALAAGKWIVSFRWIESCITANSSVPEDEFEVLDSSGEMGPQISRTRTSKIFQGFTFYCCPPFSVISTDILNSILKAAGGEVVERIEDIEIKDPCKISILLGEPSSTEDDRFIDMMINNRIVPINFDWVTECLGEGTLCNAGNYLLVPRSLLPNVNWSLNLTTDESMEADIM